MILSGRLTHFFELLLKLKSKFFETGDGCVSFSRAIGLDHQICSNRYYNLKKGERLKEMQEKLSLYESQLQSCDARKQEILDELNKSRNTMLNQENIRRGIEDNLNYRKTKAEVEALTQEIESLEEKILKIGGFSTYEVELAKLSQERERALEEVYIYIHKSPLLFYLSIGHSVVDWCNKFTITECDFPDFVILYPCLCGYLMYLPFLFTFLV